MVSQLAGGASRRRRVLSAAAATAPRGVTAVAASLTTGLRSAACARRLAGRSPRRPRPARGHYVTIDRARGALCCSRKAKGCGAVQLGGVGVCHEGWAAGGGSEDNTVCVGAVKVGVIEPIYVFEQEAPDVAPPAPRTPHPAPGHNVGYDELSEPLLVEHVRRIFAQTLEQLAAAGAMPVSDRALAGY
ncbi:unnamed protein product [Chrysodeixis includens]|uniref:Uncharacterized protein n=1 Tax=Chrysodeixis includens TaxID=689277 RepID=A0A9N8PYH6_CHRIL|nr:unnamed protein product [Chrysodeixis includens]